MTKSINTADEVDRGVNNFLCNIVTFRNLVTKFVIKCFIY